MNRPANQQNQNCSLMVDVHKRRKSMPDKKKATRDDQNDMKSIDDYLDEALEETFPASDPVAISRPDKKKLPDRDRNKETGHQ